MVVWLPELILLVGTLESLFFASEAHRKEMAGTPLAHRCCILHLRGDWAEFTERFGYPAHSSNTRPCFCCSVDRSSMFSPVGISLASAPWYTNTDDDYEVSCRSCEVTVHVTEELHPKIRRALHFDKRASATAGRGRSMASSLPEAGLLAGDRLEVTAQLPDTAMFDALTTFPVDVVFLAGDQAKHYNAQVSIVVARPGPYPYKNNCAGYATYVLCGAVAWLF